MINVKYLYNKTKLQCKYCNNDFHVPGFMAKKQKFCSRKCCNADIKQTKRHKGRGINKVSKCCLSCNNIFQTHKYREQTTKYCSKRCYTVGQFGKLHCIKCNSVLHKQHWIYNSSERQKYCEPCLRDELNISSTSSFFQKNVTQWLQNTYNNYIKINARIKYDHGKYIYPDIILFNKLVIECQGDFFHCNPEIYNENFKNPKTGKYAHEIWARDKFKQTVYTNNGLDVYYIWESDWIKNKEKHQLYIEKYIIDNII